MIGGEGKKEGERGKRREKRRERAFKKNSNGKVREFSEERTGNERGLGGLNGGVSGAVIVYIKDNMGEKKGGCGVGGGDN